MKLLTIVIDLPRTMYTISDKPTLAHYATLFGLKLLTILAALNHHLTLARFATCIAVIIITSVLSEIARQPDEVFTHLALGIVGALVDSQLKGVSYA